MNKTSAEEAVDSKPTLTEIASTADDAVISAKTAKVTESFHCTTCQPSKSGYKLSYNTFNDKTKKLTHHFVSGKEELAEPCGGKQ